MGLASTLLVRDLLYNEGSQQRVYRIMTTQNALAKRPDRTWLVVLVVVITLLTLSGAFVWVRLTSPSDGARLVAWRADGIVVTPLEVRPGGLREGDVVVAVAGRSMESWAQALLVPEAQPLRWQVGESVTYTVMRDGHLVDLSVRLERYPSVHLMPEGWEGAFIFALVSLAIAIFVFFKRPRERAAQVMPLAASAMLASTPLVFGLQVGDLIDRTGFWLYQSATLSGFVILWSAALHFTLVFPHSRAFVVRRRWLVPALYATLSTSQMVYILAARFGTASALDWIGRWNGYLILLKPVYLSLVLIATITSYRSTHSTVSRQQVRWVVFATVVAVTLYLALGIIPGSLLGYTLISINALMLINSLVPLALAVAILRYRLFDIDIIINRTLVYGFLTACIVGLYILAVGFLGVLLQAQGRLAISLAATGLVAVIFQPLRDRLQRGVNRLLYGERDDPYAVLSRLGRRLEASLAPDTVLPAIVATVTEALKLPYAAITLQQGEEFLIAAASGMPVTASLALPLVYQGETVGQLILAPRSPDTSFSPADRRLLDDLARQAGVAAHAVRLTTELQRLTFDLQQSRERLVTTREEERRRLRRDLHDGIGPTLASLAQRLDTARSLVAQDPDTAVVLLGELKTQVKATITDIRRLVYALRPPALDEFGLVAAIREHAAQYNQANGLCVSVVAPDRLLPLPAAVEVAAYRIALEALTNVARHAQAKHCHIDLEMTSDPALCLEITDDGCGLPDNGRAGVGLSAMRERAAELGGECHITREPLGGTRVWVRLPLPKE